MNVEEMSVDEMACCQNKAVSLKTYLHGKGVYKILSTTKKYIKFKPWSFT
jgi:hypothetical protein